MSTFLSGLSPTVRSQVQGDSISTLTATFSKVIHVFTRASVFFLHHLLISLPWMLDVVEVVVADATLEEDVAHLA